MERFSSAPDVNMSAIKDGRFPIKLDKIRYLLFSLNVMDELQDKMGDFTLLDEFLSGKDQLKNLRWILTLLINEGADEGEEPLTERKVGKLIHTGNFVELHDAIFESFSIGTTGGNKSGEGEEDGISADGDDEKNAESGREQ